MERLFSPWRSRYIATFKNEAPRSGESLFTRIIRERDDARNLVLQRRKTCMVMMNLYPYNSGHLMIVPYRQLAGMQELTVAENADIMNAAGEMIGVLTAVLKPHGFNFGANLGRAAGAGVDDHIHFHIVPRWNGDTNFMPVLGEVKVVSEEMRSLYKKLKAAMKKRPTVRRRRK